MTTAEESGDGIARRHNLRPLDDPGGDGRPLAEDLALPVIVEPNGHTSEMGEVWNWQFTSSSQPNAATFHINHSDVTRSFAETLTQEDSPREAPFVITRDIPIVVIDSLDKYWAGESRRALPLNGLRVPVEGDTIAEAKSKLAADLAAQIRLLLLLSRGGTELAPQLQDNLVMLSQFLSPR
jgi:hypothetical protein